MLLAVKTHFLRAFASLWLTHWNHGDTKNTKELSVKSLFYNNLRKKLITKSGAFPSRLRVFVFLKLVPVIQHVLQKLILFFFRL
jgi:hypothetical protein